MWTPQQQRVAIYTIVLFDDAVRSTSNRILTPKQKVQLKKNANISDIMSYGGQYASIFDISELILKLRVNDLCYQLNEELIPQHLFGDKETLSSE